MHDALLLAAPGPGFDPLDGLAGLSLVARAVLTLQKAGIERVRVVAPSELHERLRAELADPRVKVAVELATDAAAVTGPVLVSSVADVVDPAVFRALRAASLGEKRAVAASRGEVSLGPALVSAQGATELSPQALEGWLSDGTASRLDVGGAWHERADTPEGRTRAFRELFEACRKPVDGMVSRHLNRHVSIFISKRIVDTAITPNQMSVVTFVLGLAGAWSVARGGYWWSLLGAFLFQWNSILDGVDGELARVRFQHSKLGQWVDTVADDVSNVIFYAGLAYGAAPLPHGHELFLCGWVAVGATLLTMAQNYVELVRLGSGDFYALGWAEKKPSKGLVTQVVGLFERVLKKDFFIFLFLCMAAVGALPWALGLAAFGSVLAFGAASARNLRKLKVFR